MVLTAHSGDPKSLAHLLAACRTDARWYATRHCLPGDIEEALHETLSTLSGRARIRRSLVAFSIWLCVIWRHECRRLIWHLFGLGKNPERGGEDALAAQSDDMLRAELLSALESLPPHYLEIILLRDFEGLTLTELAAHLSSTRADTQDRLLRAREMIREYLLASLATTRH